MILNSYLQFFIEFWIISFLKYKAEEISDLKSDGMKYFERYFYRKKWPRTKKKKTSLQIHILACNWISLVRIGLQSPIAMSYSEFSIFFFQPIDSGNDHFRFVFLYNARCDQILSAREARVSGRRPSVMEGKICRGKRTYVYIYYNSVYILYTHSYNKE